MPTINITGKTADDAQIYYKDWGVGPPIVLCHGWPLNADMWEYQMNFLANNGHRVIAYDRRGFGRSSQPWTGYDYDTFADDLATVINHLDLQNVMLVGFSMGGGEVARYLSRHRSKRTSKAVLLGSVTPLMIRRDDNPEGIDPHIFDGMRQQLVQDRADFLNAFGPIFTGSTLPNSPVTKSMLEWTFFMALQASLKGTFDCVQAFSETDFREDLKNIDIPTLIIHGTCDAVVPIDVTARASAELIPGSTLKLYDGAPHALYFTHKDQVNADLLDFARS